MYTNFIKEKEVTESNNQKQRATRGNTSLFVDVKLNKTSKTPEGRNATLGVHGLRCFPLLAFLVSLDFFF